MYIKKIKETTNEKDEQAKHYEAAIKEIMNENKEKMNSLKVLLLPNTSELTIKKRKILT